MKNLYIDFDGVIMNTIEITYKDMIDKNIDQNSQKDIRKYYTDLNWKELLEKNEIINDGMNAIKNILNSKKYEVSILSHVNSLPEAVEKIKLIRKYFKNMTIIPVPRELSKTEMVHVENSILIDDYAKNLEEWKEKGGIGIRFNSDLKGKGFKVINKLDQILEIDI